MLVLLVTKVSQNGALFEPRGLLLAHQSVGIDNANSSALLNQTHGNIKRFRDFNFLGILSTATENGDAQCTQYRKQQNSFEFIHKGASPEYLPN